MDSISLFFAKCQTSNEIPDYGTMKLPFYFGIPEIKRKSFFERPEDYECRWMVE